MTKSEFLQGWFGVKAGTWRRSSPADQFQLVEIFRRGDGFHVKLDNLQHECGVCESLDDAKERAWAFFEEQQKLASAAAPPAAEAAPPAPEATA